MIDQLSLERLSAETAPSQSLSIRYLSGGLAFCVRMLPPAGEIVACGFLPFSLSSEKKVEEKFLELFYTYDFLAYPYHQIYCYYHPESAVLVPTELVTAGQEGLWLFEGLDDVKPRPVGDASVYYLSTPLPEETKSLVTRTDSTLVQLFRRTLLVVELIPACFPALSLRLEHSRGFLASELLVLLEGNQLTLLAHRRGEVFSYRQVSLRVPSDEKSLGEEVLFYLFAQWQHLGLDGAIDRVALGMSAPDFAMEVVREEQAYAHLKELLAPYVQTVEVFTYSPC